LIALKREYLLRSLLLELILVAGQSKQTEDTQVLSNKLKGTSNN
jgi:hypothetical protein